MASGTVKILGIPISRDGLEEAIRDCATRVESASGGYVCFANVHTVTEGQTDQDLRSTLDGSFRNFADGLPLVWVSKVMGQAVESRVCGPDFFPKFVHAHPEYRYVFAGGAPGQAEAIADKFNISAICYSPPMRPFSPRSTEEDWKHILSLGTEGKPQVVWVGLGAPKQEFWMREASKLAPGVLFFGVGAAFDFLSGSKTRAPRLLQKLGLEWAYRLVQEPRRLWKRYWVTNTRFVWLMLKAALGSRPS